MDEKKEIRNTAYQVQVTGESEEKRTVEGYAVLFNTPSDGLYFEEVIERGALDGVLEKSDVFALLNHSQNRGILARSNGGNGSLVLKVDEKGLKYRFEAPKTALGEELLENIRRGEISASSFCFDVEIDTWEKKSDNTRLYIQADEDHVHLQIGGISQPRLITVYEENINGKLIGKKKFGGIYNKKIDDLWEEVYTYIENKYNYEKIEKIFIMGDGANWIKTGLQWLPKSIYVADRFHLEKALTGLCGKDDKEQKSKIREAMYEFDYVKVKELGYEILAEEMKKSVRERKLKELEYILNNEEGFRNSVCYDVPGCAAEGDISHTYSDRLSSRPLGWKTINVNNVSKLRLIKADNKEIKEIVHNKRKLIEFKEIEKIRHVAKEKIKESINFKVGTIPVMEFGTTEQRKFFKQLLEYKKAI